MCTTMSEGAWVRASEEPLECSTIMVDGTLVVGEARSGGERLHSPVWSEEDIAYFCLLPTVSKERETTVRSSWNAPYYHVTIT